MKDLYLRKGAERRLRGGHLWVYSNEVDTKLTPLGDYSSGDEVIVRDVSGNALGSAYMEPQSLICGRMYAPLADQALDQAFFSARFSAAAIVSIVGCSCWALMRCFSVRTKPRQGDYGQLCPAPCSGQN